VNYERSVTVKLPPCCAAAAPSTPVVGWKFETDKPFYYKTKTRIRATQLSQKPIHISMDLSFDDE
jgi:hypothetical protein